MSIIEFLCWSVVLALFVAWVIIVSEKWRIREWLQVHADDLASKFFPSYDDDFFNRLFSCNFCCAFHLSMIISLTLFLFVGEWQMLLLPFCSTIITINCLR